MDLAIDIVRHGLFCAARHRSRPARGGGKSDCGPFLELFPRVVGVAGILSVAAVGPSHTVVFVRLARTRSRKSRFTRPFQMEGKAVLPLPILPRRSCRQGTRGRHPRSPLVDLRRP